MEAEGPPQDGRRGTGESSASSGKAEAEGKTGDRTGLFEADNAAGGVDGRQDRLIHSVAGPRHGPRLQKVLAERGYGSRRVSEELIADGRVTVNGDTAVLGRRIDLDTDVVEVDGHLVPVRPGLVHYLLNKPTGVVSTASDPQGRPTVVSLVPDEPRVYPVGRLDADSEGLMLLTNDGELTHRLTHPSFGVEKEYLAHVEGTPSAHALRQLRYGVELDDGPTAPAQVSQPEPGVLRLTIHEGRNRQVRRMAEAVGHPVQRLVRVRIGPIADRSLRPGEWRPLTVAEVKALNEATNRVEPADPPTN